MNIQKLEPTLNYGTKKFLNILHHLLKNQIKLIHTYTYALKLHKLQKEGIFFLIHLFARDILLMKKFEIEETKTT